MQNQRYEAFQGNGYPGIDAVTLSHCGSHFPKIWKFGTLSGFCAKRVCPCILYSLGNEWLDDYVPPEAPVVSYYWRDKSKTFSSCFKYEQVTFCMSLEASKSHRTWMWELYLILVLRLILNSRGDELPSPLKCNRPVDIWL